MTLVYTILGYPEPKPNSISVCLFWLLFSILFLICQVTLTVCLLCHEEIIMEKCEMEQNQTQPALYTKSNSNKRQGREQRQTSSADIWQAMKVLWKIT